MRIFKELFYLIKKHRRLKYIDKQCDKYFHMEAKLKAQARYVHSLKNNFENTYNEKIDKKKLEE